MADTDFNRFFYFGSWIAAIVGALFWVAFAIAAYQETKSLWAIFIFGVLAIGTFIFLVPSLQRSPPSRSG